MTKKNAEKKITRPPIVTIMGHVDHGKTSILDAIRETRITATESGGITQHIGAYTVEKDGKRITFVDTPGHEAFTEMRARGGKAADIVILVVAADDGVMPQTKEAIMHAKAAKVPIIVAINKVDLPGANVTRVKQQLAENEIAVEGYGGDIVAVETSAVKNTGIDQLLDVINLIAEMQIDELIADPKGNFEALIIESEHDQKRGILVSAVVKNGTLKVRDDVVAKGIEARVKSLTDSLGNSLNEAGLGDAVEILGFSDIPQIGNTIYKKNEAPQEALTEKEEIAEKREPVDPFEQAAEDGKKQLNIVLRADTSGTQEAIVFALEKLKIEDAEINILFAATGEVKESDILLASSGKGIVVAFKVSVPSSVKDIAETQGVIVREHEIIYKLIEELEGALEGVIEIEESKIKGKGLVIKKFTLPKSQMLVVGILITAGKFKNGNRVGIYRDGSDAPIHVTKIRSVHVGPKEVDQANKGAEAGLLLKPQIKEIQLDDEIEVL